MMLEMKDKAEGRLEWKLNIRGRYTARDSNPRCGSFKRANCSGVDFGAGKDAQDVRSHARPMPGALALRSEAEGTEKARVPCAEGGWCENACPGLVRSAGLLLAALRTNTGTSAACRSIGNCSIALDRVEEFNSRVLREATFSGVLANKSASNIVSVAYAFDTCSSAAGTREKSRHNVSRLTTRPVASPNDRDSPTKHAESGRRVFGDVDHRCFMAEYCVSRPPLHVAASCCRRLTARGEAVASAG